MKIIVSIYIIFAFGLIYTSCDAVCTEQMWINELQQDIAYNGKLDCLRVPLPPPKDRTESEEEKRKRIEAVWDTDCAFEAAYDWLTPLKEKFGLKNGLVDKDGKSVETDFDYDYFFEFYPTAPSQLGLIGVWFLGLYEDFRVNCRDLGVLILEVFRFRLFAFLLFFLLIFK